MKNDSRGDISVKKIRIGVERKVATQTALDEYVKKFE
jgi:hypothetical protein